MKASPIKLIVGLGNPGEKYTKTRHNAGFLFLDRLLSQHFPGISLRPDKNLLGSSAQVEFGLGSTTRATSTVRLLAPSTFMNLSGSSVQAALSYYKLQAQQILVVHDELDLDPGIARIKLGGGHGGNNGLRHITQVLGTSDFARLRVGIGHPGVGRDVASYVLKQANLADQDKIDLAIDESIAVLDRIVSGDCASAMNDLHTRLSVTKPKKKAAEKDSPAEQR